VALCGIEAVLAAMDAHRHVADVQVFGCQLLARFADIAVESKREQVSEMLSFLCGMRYLNFRFSNNWDHVSSSESCVDITVFAAVANG
jgi:hypothetical protein